MTDKDLIDALGGGVALAEELSRRTGKYVSNSSVSNWRRRGIAWRWRVAVARLAEERGLAVRPDFLTPKEV